MVGSILKVVQFSWKRVLRGRCKITLNTKDLSGTTTEFNWVAIITVYIWGEILIISANILAFDEALDFPIPKKKSPFLNLLGCPYILLSV